jgi:hypothetical protein
MILVAPLTTALMGSIPVRNSGVGSAINNAISRVGPQLAGALIFVFITANFYGYLAGKLTVVDVTDPKFRSAVSPLNTPLDPHLIGVVRDASTSSFHIAMIVAALLLIIGAAVNGIGIQNKVAQVEPAPAAPAPTGNLAKEGS